MSEPGHMGGDERMVSTDGAARKCDARRLAVDEMPERLSDIIARLMMEWAAEMKK